MKKLLSLTTLLSALNVYAQSPIWSWAYGDGGTLLDKSMSLAVDGNNDSYVAGGFESSPATFGSYTLNNALADSLDVYLVRYNASGIVQWVRGAGGVRNDEATCVAADMSGNAIVAGYFYSSSITFGTFTLNNTSGYSDMFIAKYDASGTAIWAYNFGGVYDDQVLAVECDNNGNIYLTGYFLADSLIMGTDTALCAGTYDMFVAKLDSAGNLLWLQSAGTSGDERGTAITVDPNGNVIAGGTFNTSNFIVGNDTLIYAGGAYSDMFLTKYDAAGNNLWAFEEGGTYLDEVQDLSIDQNGNIYLAAQVYSSGIIIGSDTMNNSGSSFYCDVVIAKYDLNGTPQWAEMYGVGTGNDIVYAIDVDPNGVSYITGIHGSGIDFGGNILSGTGVFVVRHESSGMVFWAVHVDGASGTGVAIGIGDGIFVSGNVYAASATFGAFNVSSAGSNDIYIAHLSQVLDIPLLAAVPSITAWPNPARDYIKVNGILSQTSHSYSIFNSLGQEVISQTLLPGENVIDVAALAPGVYCLRIGRGTTTFNRE